MNFNNISNDFGCNTFSDNVMRERIPKSTYKAFHDALEKGEELSKETATVIANAMKLWAIEKGATHFTHWFMPMTGLTAEKHDAFLSLDNNKVILEFSGKTLRKGESDASSFPSGGLRETFEARGYTAWDCTSPAFVKDGTLYIPTLFCSYTGEALDKKTPLLRSCDSLSRASRRLLPLLGINGINKVVSTVGSEQEYFLIDDKYYQGRMDLKLTGRTLFGAKAPKGQRFENHYFGSIKSRVASFMRDLDSALWHYGIPSKTKHNEAAPAQHEVACIYNTVNITADNNYLLMQLMQETAKKHGLRCILHEKPFAGVNGSGKHNNWSIQTDNGINLFEPGNNPKNNLPFLAMIACVLKGIDDYADLLAMSVASASNDHRLGGNEAPPAIISIFLGDELENLIDSLIEGKEVKEVHKNRFDTGVSVIPTFSKDSTDRNRTSPLAFTGNKFEFRSVGSSQSIAGPNTILNVILAEEMEQMAILIESGMEPIDVIKKFLKEHKRIVFNGDGYSRQWEEEAKKRGLANHTNTVDALDCLKIEKNIEMLSKHRVYSHVEIASRHDILLENYNKTIEVESLTALKMVKTQIYPAVLKYLSHISKAALHIEKIKLDNTFIVNDVKVLLDFISLMRKQTSDLEKKIMKAQRYNGDIHSQAIIWRDEVLLIMNDLRVAVDTIESMVDIEFWPMPTYLDLLFGI